MIVTLLVLIRMFKQVKQYNTIIQDNCKSAESLKYMKSDH